MPSYLPGIFVMVAGAAMIIGRKPLSLSQYAALERTHIIRKNRDETLVQLRRIIVVGSVLFILLGIYLALTPLYA